MLLTIEFPNNFVVPNLAEVQKMNLVPGIERSALAMDGIKMPVNFGAVIQITIAQQPEAVLHNFICFLDHLVDNRGQVLLQQLNPAIQLFRREEEITAHSPIKQVFMLKWNTRTKQGILSPFPEFLGKPGTKLVPTDSVKSA